MSAASGVDVLQGYFENVKSEVSKQDPIILGVAVAVIVILFTIVLLRLFRGNRNNRRSVLVLGLCESGKTLLYTRLIHKKAIESYTSIKENVGPYQVTGQSSMLLEVVDIPGNDRQRIHVWNRFKTQARGVVFLVDSSSIQNDVKEVAEFLYTLLSDATTTNLGTPFLIACNKLLGMGVVFLVDSSSIGKDVKEVAEFLYTLLSDVTTTNFGTPFLIACNKQDITMAKSSRIIQTLLEKEMTTLRVTRAATLSSTDGSAGDTNTFLGKQGKDFDFSYLSNPVDFVECSAKGSSGSDDGELNTVTEWISNLV